MKPVSYQRAMVLVTASSLLVPVIGLATAPILTQSLGVAGRGAAGAALAPNLLIVGGATLGLPQALTFLLASRPHLARRALALASVLSAALGAVALVAVFFARSFLSGGDAQLEHLLILGTWLALPALIVGLLRGAATGLQMWVAVALERVVNSIIRLVLLGALALAGRLDVTAAVVVMSLAPVVAGIAYVGVFRRSRHPVEQSRVGEPFAAGMVRFGSQVWLAAVATMLMARLSQLLVTPLSSVEQLGLLIVAITISDVPYIVTQTVRDVTFGASSAESDTDRLLSTSRVATLIAFAGSAVLGVSLPFWIDIVFGAGFDAALLPTWLLLATSCIAVPGLIAGAGLDAAGRPGLRSVSLVLALIVNLVGLLLLVPPLGAVGGALAALGSTTASTVFMVAVASRLLKVKAHLFFVPGRQDGQLLVQFVRLVLRRLPGGKRG